MTRLLTRLFAMPSYLGLVWCGVLIGGSFVAAPAKFTAPSLTTPVALEVGRAQFHALGITEGVIAVALVLALLLLRPKIWWLFVIPVGALCVQWLFVMPPLDARTLAIIGGADPGPSSLHYVYIGLEIIKVGSLIAAAVIAVGTDKLKASVSEPAD